MEKRQKKHINAVLVVGGKWHDFDYARLELLKLLAEDDRVRHLKMPIFLSHILVMLSVLTLLRRV